MFDRDIDRRKFLKLTSAGIFSTLVLNEVSPLFAEIASSGKNVSMLSKEFRKAIPTFCNLCPAQCGILGFVEGNWLAGIQGNPKHPNNRGKICARGVAGMNLVHDPERILFPLKRAGKRGDGKWTQISWQQALAEVSAKLNPLRQQQQSSRIVLHIEERIFTGLTRRFFKSVGQPTIIASPIYSDPNKAFAQKITWGESFEVPDIENSRFILLFGANPYESHPQYINLSQRIIEARLNHGAKLVTIDPRLSNTAGRSDEWCPIYPGTDGLLALAMANVIMQNELHDAEFITNGTNISVADLKNYLAQFTIEKASEVSTIPAQTIERIAIDFASRKPAVAISGSGVTKRSHGVDNERCIMLLNAVVGNIDRKGGFCLPRKFNLTDFSNESSLNSVSADFYKLVESNQRRVGSFISCLSNPAYESPDAEQVTELFKDEKKIPFLAVIDHVMSETATLADIVLPAATHLESWDLSVAAAFHFVPQLTIGQPVIPPIGESKSLADIWIQLAKIMGGEIARGLYYDDVQDYIQEIATQAPGLTPSRDYSQLKKEGIWISKTQGAPYEIYKRNGFRTETGKFEIASTQLRKSGYFELPQFTPTTEKVQLKKEQLFLIPFTSNVLTADLANAKWLSEIRHTSEAYINPATARTLKIRNGQKITLHSAVGELEVEAKIFQGIHPKAIALCNGLGHWASGKIARAKKFKSDDPDTELVWWEKHGNGVNPNILIEVEIDPLGKGLACKDTVVEVKKT